MKNWQAEFPNPALPTFLEKEVRPVVDTYGEVYLNAMERSFAEYGLEGLSMQLLYLAGNLKSGNRQIEKKLERWSKAIDEVTEQRYA